MRFSSCCFREAIGDVVDDYGICSKCRNISEFLSETTTCTHKNIEEISSSDFAEQGENFSFCLDCGTIIEEVSYV